MESLDLRGIPCPKNTSIALIRLSTMDQGEILEILLDDGEPIENVPPSLELEGHRIIKKEKTEPHWTLHIEVGA